MRDIVTYSCYSAADELEKCRAVEVDNDDRNKVVTEPYEINGWLGFTFPGRKEKYSDMKYHWYHFTGTGMANYCFQD